MSANLPSIEAVEVQGRSDIAGTTTDEGKGRVFPCEGCGADLVFHIGDQSLLCPYCGFSKEIELRPDAEIVEQDYLATLERLRRLKEAGIDLEVAGASEVRCQSCGGNVVFSGTLTSTHCPYCAAPIQREQVHSATQRIPVDAVLPFLIEQSRAQALLAAWMESRWFAPSAFRQRAETGRFNGVYLPYWTYDTLTLNAYEGERGENYTVRVGVGKNRRTETRTRWYPASGRFQRFFDDVLVIASAGLPGELLSGLEPWPLQRLLPFTQQVLAGLLSRTYDVPVDVGYDRAGALIKAALHADVQQRIGGDRQRVHSIKTRCDAITFKHLLLPVWMLAYRYHGQPYRVFINAATGAVQGERPYSWVKITLAICAVIVAILIVVGLMQR